MNILIREMESGEPVPDEVALAQFQRQWTTYQKLVDSDILSHNAVGDILHRTLKESFSGPFSFLDIACGDAHRMVTTLAGTGVTFYRGIDLSEPALQLARKNLADAPFEVELDHGDFNDILTKRTRSMDAAWCGLSFHHLHRDEKLSLMRAICSRVSRLFMVYEPTRLDDESRDGYMERFVRVNDRIWTMLTPDERAQIEHHVMTSDFPETSRDWRQLGLEAGFAAASELFCDPTGFYRVYLYSR